MADQWFGIDKGEGKADVTTGTSDVSKAVAIVIDDAKITNEEKDGKQLVREAVELLLLHIEEEGF